MSTTAITTAEPAPRSTEPIDDSPAGDAAVAETEPIINVNAHMWGHLSFVGPPGAKLVEVELDSRDPASPSAIIMAAQSGHFGCDPSELELIEEVKKRVPTADRPTGHCALPWDRRAPYNHDVRAAINFLGLAHLTPHVMLRLEFALRLTFIGILVCTLLILQPGVKKTWTEGAMIMVNCIVAMQPRLGTTVEHVGLIWASLLVYLPTAVICIAINSAQSSWGWYVLYCGVVMLIATFTQGLVTKMSLFFFSIVMVLHKIDEITIDGTRQSLMFPLNFMVPCVLGTGIALCVPLLPIPRTHRAVAETSLQTIFSSISICFIGGCHSVWTCSSTDRRVNRARIQTTRRAVNYAFTEAERAIEQMRYEPWPASIQSRAEQRLELAERLLSSLDGLLTFVDSLADDGRTIDHSVRAQRWGSAFIGSLYTTCQYLDEFLLQLHDLSQPVTPEMLRRIEIARAVLERGYTSARDYALEGTKINERVDFPFVTLGFFLFNFGTFHGAIRHYEIEREEGGDLEGPLQRLVKWPVRGITGAAKDALNFVRLTPDMVLRFREAVKVAFAMTTAMILLVYLQAPDAAGGAAVIGFVKDADPSLTVVASVEFVLGTVLGSILGYLCASVSQTLTDVHIWMCVLAFVTGFVRSGSRYGGIGFLTQFFGLTTLLAVNVSSTATLVKIQQNVAAMLWLSFTHLVLFPLWPSTLLEDELMSTLESTAKLLAGICTAIEKEGMEEADLEALRVAVRASTTKLRALLPHAVAEPDVKKLPFPEFPTRALMQAMEVILSLSGPAIAAVLHELRLRKSEAGGNADAPQCETMTLPQHVFEEQQHAMPRMSLVVEELLRSLVSAMRVEHDDTTANIIRLHSRLEAACAELNTRVHVVLEEQALKARPAPFRMPALQVVTHFFAVLPHALNQLVSTVVEYRKAKLLRG